MRDRREASVRVSLSHNRQYGVVMVMIVGFFLFSIIW